MQETSACGGVAVHYLPPSSPSLLSSAVLAVIHQPPPEVFTLFDKLLLLSRGDTVFFGDAHNVEEFFTLNGLRKPEGMGVADFILHAINEDFSAEDVAGLDIETAEGCEDIQCNIR